jgi:hypothetical protein
VSKPAKQIPPPPKQPKPTKQIPPGKGGNGAKKGMPPWRPKKNPLPALLAFHRGRTYMEARS